MSHKHIVAGCLAIAAAALGAGSAAAQDTIKIGMVMQMTGPNAAGGREISAAAKLYMAQHGDSVAGKKIELIFRDDASIPDNAKRLAQELIINDKVSLLAAGITPSAMAMAPIATEAKVPTVVTISGTSVVTERSPYYVRTSFTLGQQSGIIADWAIKNGSRKAVAVLSDWAPGSPAANRSIAASKAWVRPASSSARSTAATMIGAASPTAIGAGAMATRAWACRSQPDSAANTPPASVRSARPESRTSSGWRRSKARCAALW